MRWQVGLFHRQSMRDNATMRPLRFLAGLALLIVNPPALGGELADLLRDTLTHPGVSASQYQVEAARDQLAAATSRYFGSGGASAETVRYEDLRFVGVLSPATFADPPFARDIARYGLHYSLPIDLTGTLAASKRAAEHDLAAAQLAERQTTLLKVHDATSAYARLQALLRQKDVLAVQRQRVAQTVERVRQQVESEQSSLAELRLAEAELARQQSDEVRLTGAVEEQQAALEEATGRRLLPGSYVIVLPAWSAQHPEELLPAALAGARADSADAQAREARRALWLSPSIGADYFRFDGDGYAPDTWSLMARVTLPLDPAAWRRASAARAQANAAARALEAAQREVQRSWTALEAAYRAAVADEAALVQEIAARQEVVRVQAELQRVGMASLEDFLRQQRDLLDAESRRADAQVRAVMAWSAAQVLQGTGIQRYLSQVDSAGGAGPESQ